MPKNGTITSPSGADANMRALGDTTPPVGTIASIIRAALNLATALKFVAINLLTGKGIVAATATDPATIDALGDVLGTFSKDDPSKATSPWTFTKAAGVAADGALNPIAEQLVAVCAARKPSMSVESLTNGIEDVQNLAEGALFDNDPADGLVLYYDQANGNVKVVVGNMDGVDLAGMFVEDAAYLRTPASTSGTQFGE